MAEYQPKHTSDELRAKQALPLDVKIQMAQDRIREWYDYYNGLVYVGFSGGKDSTVLLSLARNLYPEVPAVFCDTGLEYPTIRSFVKTVENVHVIRPIKYDRHKKEYVPTNFRETVMNYGYPIASKEISQKVYSYRHHNCSPEFIEKMLVGRNGRAAKIPKKWQILLDAPFDVGSQCCTIMKKTPFKVYEKTTGRRGMLGLMADESELRRQSWIKEGCNAFDTNRPISRPIMLWTEQDVLKYIVENNLRYSEAYGEIIQDENGLYHCTKCHRTGCIYCGYGAHMEKEPNRFQKLKVDYPKLYEYCMREVGGVA